MGMSKSQVFYQSTPNPDSLKFTLDRVVGEQTVDFKSQEEAGPSPLAFKILGFPWAAGVLVGPNFVTVTKHNWVEWEILADPLSDLIAEHLDSNQPVMNAGGSQDNSTQDSPDDSEVVQRIKRILREDIKPAVAMDGGDISFDRFEEGRVYLSLLGSCSGCPSSTMTLKEGIETRLKAAVPEVIEVISV